MTKEHSSLVTYQTHDWRIYSLSKVFTSITFKKKLFCNIAGLLSISMSSLPRAKKNTHGIPWSWENSKSLAGIAQWLERQTRDCKVAGSYPCWNGGRIFFSRVDFLCWLLFRYPFHPRVTAVARKRSWSLCQKCRWQVTAKHAYTLRLWLCMKWHGAWLYGVHRTCRYGTSFMWHKPCQHCMYTTSVDIHKRAIES